MSKVHVAYITFVAFRKGIEAIRCEKNRLNMTNLLKLTVAHDLIQDSLSLFESGYFRREHPEMLREFEKDLFGRIMP